MTKFQVGDRVRAASPQAPIVEVLENLGRCDYPHDCQGQFLYRAVSHDGPAIDHVDDFEKAGGDEL